MKYSRLHSTDLRAEKRWLLKSRSRALAVAIYLQDVADYSTTSTSGYPTATVTLAQIARDTASTISQVRFALAQLAEHGLIDYRPNPRRNVQITLLCWGEPQRRAVAQAGAQGEQPKGTESSTENSEIVAQSEQPKNLDDAYKNTQCNMKECHRDDQNGTESSTESSTENSEIVAQSEQPKNLDDAYKNTQCNMKECHRENANSSTENSTESSTLLKNVRRKEEGVCGTHTAFDLTEDGVRAAMTAYCQEIGIEGRYNVDARAKRFCKVYSGSDKQKRWRNERDIRRAIELFIDGDVEDGRFIEQQQPKKKRQHGKGVVN